MFICTDCGCVFDEPATYGESHPYGEGYAVETLACCPNCGEGFEEAVQCKYCGEYFSKDDLNNGICDECLDDLHNLVADAITNIISEDLYEYIPDEFFDNIWDKLYDSYDRKRKEEEGK